MKKAIRPYQAEMIINFFMMVNEGIKRMTLMMPTGSGKLSVTFECIRYFFSNIKNRVLFVSDRQDVSKNCENAYITLCNEIYEQSQSLDMIKRVDFVIVNSRTQFLDQKNSLYNSIYEGNYACIVFYELRKEHRMMFKNVLSNGNVVTLSIGSFFMRDELPAQYEKYGGGFLSLFSSITAIDVRDISDENIDEINLIKKQIEKVYDLSQKYLADLFQYSSGNSVQLRELEKQAKVIQSMQDIASFHENLLYSLGLDKSDLDNAYNKISVERIKLNEALNNKDCSLGEEIIIKNFQDAVTEIQLKIFNKFITSNSLETYVALLKRDLGNEVWSKLSADSQKFLISSEMTFDSMKRNPGFEKLDYSGVCLLITKAVELEAHTRFFVKYLSYLQRRYPLPGRLGDWPNATLGSKKTPLQEDEFTLGKLPSLMGIDNITWCSHEESYSAFSKFMSEEVFNKNIRVTEYLGKITTYCKFLETVRKDYRNPSAHRNTLNMVTASECINYVIRTKFTLKYMLEDFRL